MSRLLLPMLATYGSLGWDGIWYLASPYTDCPLGRKKAFEVVAKKAAELAKAKVQVFCPIAHSHPMALHGDLEGGDFDFWMQFDDPFMRASVGLLIYMMPGWKDSRGVIAELEHFRKAGKPVWGLPYA